MNDRREKKIVLISCVKKKLPKKAKAEYLYTSPLFKGNLQFAKTLNPDEILILSAKYGLVELHDEIEPYDVTLKNMKVQERKSWAFGVIKQLKNKFDLKKDFFIILAGVSYRQYVLPELGRCEIPLEGLSLGKQLRFLKSKTK